MPKMEECVILVPLLDALVNLDMIVNYSSYRCFCSLQTWMDNLIAFNIFLNAVAFFVNKL